MQTQMHRNMSAYKKKRTLTQILQSHFIVDRILRKIIEGNEINKNARDKNKMIIQKKLTTKVQISNLQCRYRWEVVQSTGDRWLTGNEYQWWCKSVKQKQSPTANNGFGAGERRIGCGQKAITQSSDGGGCHSQRRGTRLASIKPMWNP